MSDVVVANTDAELAGLLLSTEGVKTATLTLTNADIKSYPAIFEIVADAGAGKINVPLWAVVWTDFTGGAYGNVHSGGDGVAYLGILTNDGNGYGLSYLENVATESISDFTDLFTNTTKRVFVMTIFTKAITTDKASDVPVQSLSDFQGNIVFNIVNASDGAFNGGNASNTIKILLAYTVVTL